MNRIEVRASAAPAHLLRCSNSHYDCGSQLSNRGNRQYEMKLLYWMAAASEGRQPLSITAKMRIAAFHQFVESRISQSRRPSMSRAATFGGCAVLELSY